MANMLRMLCSLGLVTLLPLAAGAKTTTRANPDQHFAQQAAVGGLMEVELGKLAQSKASSDDVKQFGQRMVDDHGKANERLQGVAKGANITLPTSLPADKQKTVDRLAKLDGAAFDREYMSMMVKDHTEDVADFQHEASQKRTSPVHDFATETLPTLKEHLQLAKTTAAKVGASGGTHHKTSHR